MEINEVESTPVGKRKQGITNSDNIRLKRDERLDKMKELEKKGTTLRLKG